MTLASAPGKLFIAGEYAILDRGTALVAAVGARANVRAEKSADSSFSFSHPVSGKVLRFDLDREGGLQWSGKNPGHWGDVLAAVFATWNSHEHVGSSLLPLSICIDTEAFYSRSGGEHRKLGFGSSAAAIVALSQAVMTETGSGKEKTDLARFCLDAHSRLQRGRGSGADVLVSLTGGVIAATAGGEVRQSMSWPTGLHVLAVWSGVEASSAALVGRFEAYRSHSKGYSRHMDSLRDASSLAVSAWQADDVPLILSALRDCDAALLNLDSDSQIGIYTEIHGRLRTIAETEGAVYKVSGAGGGDFGLVFSQSAEISMRARDAFEASGFSIFDMGVAESGVRVDSD